MKVLWTPRAADDLDALVDYISADRPDAALRVADKIYNHVMLLAKMPQMGRLGDVSGTRELVFHP
jgi:plasmid stabilization system protein ParE